MPTSVHNRAADARGAARASLYLAAALYCDGNSSPVKIRNISTTGALIEGWAIPAAGSLVQLVRGGLIVHGLVAWCTEGRGGLKFSGSVDVQQWRASPSNSEQQRVDEIVRLVKAGAVPLPVPPLSQTAEPQDECETSADLPADLGRASRLLETLGGALASDPDVVTRHGTALQNLDIAMQVIAAVEAILSGDSDLEIDATKLPGLRRSADQALKQGS
ncbi:MAG TPA: hypothetical protein VJ846_06270 [Sphingomicrobium sp.]|nr:hypothetical protein [Sphingomicrobium sp.]